MRKRNLMTAFICSVCLAAVPMAGCGEKAEETAVVEETTEAVESEETEEATEESEEASEEAAERAGGRKGSR